MSVTLPAGAVYVPGGHQAPAGDNYLNHEKTIKSWLLTLDHKRIGLMYMIGVLAAFALGGAFAIGLRTELFSPGEIGSFSKTQVWDFYNHMFTMHGAIMVFLFIIPAIPAILGNMVLPLMLGAKDVAFPRLNLLSFWIWVLGAIMFLFVFSGGFVRVLTPAATWNGWQAALDARHIGWILPGGLDTGWTFYTPYSTSKSTAGVVPATMGAFILGFSSILTGVNFIASIHMLRAPGMTWFRMPLFLWALYGTALIQILATPVLAITLMLLMAEKILGVGIFDPALGGDPVLYQHFFWFYSHPAVYIMILPAMGIISDVISVHSRKHIFGYTFIGFSSVAIALLGFLVWGHHMFVSGQSPMANAIFSLLTMSVAIPSAIKVFNWVSTLYKGDVRLTTPMMYALYFIVLFTFGGLTGLFLGAVSTDVHLTNTYFIVAHFHYVMVGSTLFAFLAGVYHWWPKMFGKMYNERVGQIAASIVFIGFNLTFFVQFIAGSLGMPRRYATYPEKFHIYMQISTIGAYVTAIGLIMVLCHWISSLRSGKKAAANPWGGNSLEWHIPSPPPHDNFVGKPIGNDPYDFSQWKETGPYEWEFDTSIAPTPIRAHP